MVGRRLNLSAWIIIALVMVLVLYCAKISMAEDDVNRLYNLSDASGMFNERGYAMSNSFSLSGNEVINDFNGNLMYSQRLLYLPISENGLHYDLKLAYNGNVSHTAFGARIGSNDIEQTPVNLPEWIISINGIAVQTFNFENELVTWKNDTSYTEDISYSDEVAAHIEGYHKCYRVMTDTQGAKGAISILMEDGSVKEYYCTDQDIAGPVQMQGGNYNPCSKDDQDRGYLWALGDQLYGYFTLFRADGTQVLFQVFQPTFRTNLDCVQSFGKTKTNYPRMLLPVQFKDAMGHEFDLSYSYTIGSETVLGRPVLDEIGETHLEWGTWTPGNYGGVQVQYGGEALYDIYYADAVLTPSTGGRGVSWHPNYNANRGQVWRISDPQQRVTKFSYRTYSRNYANMNFNSTFRVYGVCNDGNKEAGASYKLSPWRVWKIEYPEGGLSYFSYFDDLATAWASGYIPIPKDTITISYDHSPTADCMQGLTPLFPCKKSARFDELGRDPFFLNIVSAARHTNGDNTIVSTDSLFFSWNGGVDEDYSITIEDEFTTRRWFGRDSLDVQIRTVYPDIKERLLEYRYFPENGLFSRNSRDRGWVLKLIYSRDSDLNRPTYDRLSKTYYWDVTCVNNVCNGTFKLDSLVTQRGSEQYSESFSYDWLGDPALRTVNNLVRKDATDPWGLKSETYYNSDYLSLSNPATAYYNNSIIDSSRTIKVSNGIVLAKSASQYFGPSASEGHVGQLSRAVRYFLNSSGSTIDSLVDSYAYVKGGSGNVKFQGATKLHIGPMSDTTFLYFPSTSEPLSYSLLAHDGSIVPISTSESFANSGPSWFKLERHTGTHTLIWYRKQDERGRLAWVMEPNGFRSDVTYDKLNRVGKVILPGGYVPTGASNDTAWSIWNSYDDEAISDPTSITQRIRIADSRPDRINKVWVDGLSRSVRHDALNTDGSVDSVVTGYDFQGRTIWIKDQLGNITRSSYDHFDQKVCTRYPDPTGSSDSIKYSVTTSDAVGLSSMFTFPETIIFKNEYCDENSHTVYEYSDVRNKLRLRQTFDGANTLSTYFDYDDLGNLTFVKRPKGDSVRYTYNSLGQLTGEQNSDYYFWPFAKSYSYDKNGNLTGMRDPNLIEFSFNYPPYGNALFQFNSYDALNRLVERRRPTPVYVYPIGWVPYYTVYERHFYDQGNCELSKGRLSLSYNVDPNGKTNYAERYDYDPRGRIKKQVNYFHAVLDSTNISGTLWEYSVHGDSAVLAYSYDWADQLKSVTYPDGSVVKYNYDRRGHLTTVGGSAASDSMKYAQLDYTQRDALQSMKLGGGLQQLDYAYNERGWLETINGGVSSSGGVPNDLFGQKIYYYSHPSPPAGWNAQFNGNLFGQKLSMLGQDTTYAYRYDESDRLREAKRASDPFESFAYDGNGNVTSFTKRIKSSPATDIVKNCIYETGTNRLAVADRDHYLVDDSLFYDWNGNVIRHSGKKVWVQYDIDNRMIYSEIVGAYGIDKVWYHYNSSGQRVYKEHFFHYRGSCDETKKRRITESGPGGDDTTSIFCIREATAYTYYILGQGQIYAEQSTPTPLYPKAKYIYAGGSRIAMRDSESKLHYFLNDHLGSARVVIDSTGVVKDKYWYYSFGAPRSEVVSLNQSYRYTGKPFDNETGIGIYYYGARYYDPEIGRFWARDPLASKYPSLSPYAYGANNPVKYLDLDGSDFVFFIDHNRALTAGHAYAAIGRGNSWQVFSFERKDPKWYNFLFTEGEMSTFKWEGSLQSLLDYPKLLFEGEYMPDEAILIQTTPEQDAAAIAIGEMMTKIQIHYILLLMNCLNGVDMLAKAAGIELEIEKLFGFPYPNGTFEVNRSQGENLKRWNWARPLGTIREQRHRSDQDSWENGGHRN